MKATTLMRKQPAQIVTNKRSPVVHVSTEVPRPLGEAFENIARANGITKAELLRRLIRALVEDKTKIPRRRCRQPLQVLARVPVLDLRVASAPAPKRKPRHGGRRGRDSKTSFPSSSSEVLVAQMMFSDQVYRTRLRSLFTELDLLPLNAPEFG